MTAAPPSPRALARRRCYPLSPEPFGTELPMRLAIAVCLAVALCACADKASKEEEEAAKNTFVCQLQGERLVIRFDGNEARMLMPNGDRVVLYQVPSTTGVRFSNGSMELRGRGTDVTLIDRINGVQHDLSGCEPYSLPKQP